LTNTACFKGQH